MFPEGAGFAAAEIAVDTICRAVCAAGVLYVSIFASIGWILPSCLTSILTASLLVAGLSALVYFRKPKLANSQLERFLTDGVVAHRGGAADAPENTLVSMQEAKKNGAVAVEVDVELTKDGVAVLMHDATVDRTTDGTGRIGQLLWEDVRQLNAAAKFAGGSRFQSSYENVPTLEELVQECLNLKLKIYFDVKAYSKQMVAELIKLYKKYPDLYDTSMVCSFYPTTIFAVRQLDGGILTALTVEKYFLCSQFQKRLSGPATWWKLLPIAFLDRLLVWSMYSWLWFLCGNSAMLLNKDDISRDVVNYWTVRGIKVVPWTVNKKTEKEYFSHICGRYMTDYLK